LQQRLPGAFLGVGLVRRTEVSPCVVFREHAGR
jgi:hypothetical protein